MTSDFVATTAIRWRVLAIAPLFAFCVGSEALAGSTGSQNTELVGKALSATVRVETANDRSSGVVVSDLGHVLTVAHGLSRQEEGIHVVHQGQQYVAKLLKRDVVNDLVLLQLTDLPAKLPFLIASQPTRALKKADVVIATGYPARESNSSGPVVRLGVVKAVTEKYVRTNCALTAGDSGGSLVDSRGRVVGINARIGVGRDANLHIPAGIIGSFLDGVAGLNNSVTIENQTVFNTVSNALAQQKLSHLQTQVVSNNGEPICLGSRIGPRTVVTKLSLIEDKSVSVRIDGGLVAASLIGQRQDLDLAVLRVALPESSDVQIPSVSTFTIGVGELVYAKSGSRGVVARIDHAEPRSKPVLGCTLLADSQRGLLVEEVGTNSAASDADLAAGDRIVSFCGKSCQALNDIGDVLTTMQPGDLVEFEVVRHAKQSKSFGRLRHRPEALLNRSEFLDGRSGALSQRRTGFSKVIQHDVQISPTEVGGPLVDSDGRLVGVNIAVRSRESVLAVPVATVLKIIAAAKIQD